VLESCEGMAYWDDLWVEPVIALTQDSRFTAPEDECSCNAVTEQRSAGGQAACTNRYCKGGELNHRLSAGGQAACTDREMDGAGAKFAVEGVLRNLRWLFLLRPSLVLDILHMKL